MKRVLFDVNVVLDVLLDRRPQADAILQVFDVAAVDGATIQAALRLSCPDFENALTAAEAVLPLL